MDKLSGIQFNAPGVKFAPVGNVIKPIEGPKPLEIGVKPKLAGDQGQPKAPAAEFFHPEPGADGDSLGGIDLSKLGPNARIGRHD